MFKDSSNEEEMARRQAIEADILRRANEGTDAGLVGVGGS